MKLPVSVIILTRNELENCKVMFPRVPRDKVQEILVVDYASTDGTLEYFRARGVPVIHQKEPGRGRAILLGARAAKGKVLVFFSPDGNEDADEIVRLSKQCLREGCDLAIASRFLPSSRNEEDGQLIRHRKWGTYLLAYLIRLFFGGRVSDPLNGLRAIRKTVFESLALDALGITMEYQMVIRTIKGKYKVCEFPTQEGDRIYGKSKVKALPAGLAHLVCLFRELTISW